MCMCVCACACACACTCMCVCYPFFYPLSVALVGLMEASDGRPPPVSSAD